MGVDHFDEVDSLVRSLQGLAGAHDVLAAEKGLEGSTLDDASCADAADRLLAAAAPLRDNGYKVTLARELVRRALRSLVA